MIDPRRPVATGRPPPLLAALLLLGGLLPHGAAHPPRAVLVPTFPAVHELPATQPQIAARSAAHPIHLPMSLSFPDTLLARNPTHTAARSGESMPGVNSLILVGVVAALVSLWAAIRHSWPTLAGAAPQPWRVVGIGGNLLKREAERLRRRADKRPLDKYESMRADPEDGADDPEAEYAEAEKLAAEQKAAAEKGKRRGKAEAMEEEEEKEEPSESVWGADDIFGAPEGAVYDALATNFARYESSLDALFGSEEGALEGGEARYQRFLERAMDEDAPPNRVVDSEPYLPLNPVCRVFLANRLLYRLRRTKFLPAVQAEGQDELLFERPLSSCVRLQVRTGVVVGPDGRKTIAEDLATPIQLQLLYRVPKEQRDVLLCPAVRPSCDGTILDVVTDVSAAVRQLVQQLRAAPYCAGCGAPHLPAEPQCPVCGAGDAPVTASAGPEFTPQQRRAMERRLAAAVLDLLHSEGHVEDGVDVKTGRPRYIRPVPNTPFDTLVLPRLIPGQEFSVVVYRLYKDPKTPGQPRQLGRGRVLRFLYDVDPDWVVKRVRSLVEYMTNTIRHSCGKLRCKACGAPTYRSKKRGLRTCVNWCRQRRSPAQRRRREERKGFDPYDPMRGTWREQLTELGFDCSSVPVWEDRDFLNNIRRLPHLRE